MPFVRKEIRSLGATWNDTTLWYATAVGKLKERSFTDPTSWWFLAAIHGFHPVVWTEFGFMDDQTPMPTPDRLALWSQCQHQTWYFLPWHRGYLYAFEEIVRSVVVAEGAHVVERIVAPQAQLEAVLAVLRAVAGARVAAQLRDHRVHVADPVRAKRLPHPADRNFGPRLFAR